VGDGLAAGGHHHRAHRVDQAALAGVLPFAWLSFGRVRPAHTNLVLFGWSSLVLVGVSLYVVSRTSRAPLWSPRLTRIALWLWNLALFGGLVTLLAGVNRGPQEYREWVWPLAVILAAAVVIDGYVAYRTVAARALPEVYVSNWYILGGFCYLPILYVTSYLPFYQGVSATRSSRATTCTT